MSDREAKKKREPPASAKALPMPDDVQSNAIASARTRVAARSPRFKINLTLDAKGGLANIGPDHSDHDGWLLRLQDAFGTCSDCFPLSQLNQILAVSRDAAGTYDTVKVNALIAAVEGARPENEVQAMLAVQMAITHEIAAQALRRMVRVDQIPQYDSAGSMAVKLLRAFTAQAECLSRLQRGGEQVVRVVHVHPGAQAIVGNVVGGATSAGGGANDDNSNQPHAKAQLPAPSAPAMPQVWSKHAQREAVPIPSCESEGSLPDARRRKG